MIAKAHVTLLMNNSLINDWTCFGFHCMLDLLAVLTKEIVVFFIKITNTSPLVHSKQRDLIVNLYMVIFYHS